MLYQEIGGYAGAAGVALLTSEQQDGSQITLARQHMLSDKIFSMLSSYFSVQPVLVMASSKSSSVRKPCTFHNPGCVLMISRAQ